MARPIPLVRPGVRGRRVGHHLSLAGWVYLFLSWGVVVAATVYALVRLDPVWLVAVAAAAVLTAWWVSRARR
jgi:hypothetical protein